MLTVQALRAIIESHHTEAKTQQRMGWRLPYGQPARFQAWTVLQPVYVLMHVTEASHEPVNPHPRY